jgi:hypothetical protein
MIRIARFLSVGTKRSEMPSSFRSTPAGYAICLIAVILGCCTTAIRGASDVSDIPDLFLKFGIVWGDENANKIRTGLKAEGEAESLTAKVFVFGGGTNYVDHYLAPVATKFARVELRDSNGAVIKPFPGKRVAGNLPRRIVIKDLPREPIVGTQYRGRGGGLRDWLFGNPARLSQFVIQNVYPIETEGDYTLTIVAVIYKFPEDYESNVPLASSEQFVTRIDLPTVTTKIHLKPSTQTKH